MKELLEASRNELMTQSKRAEREKDGKTRYEKRLKSRVSSSNKTYNQLDMNSLLKDGIMNVSVQVKGETDDYIVKMSWGGFIDELHRELKNNNDSLDLRVVIRSLVTSFNRNDVYVSCQCPDFRYRFSYFATINKINSGEPELMPSKVTNLDDALGPACKHVMLVLANTSWIVKVSSVIVNYINYYKNHRQRDYAKLIYPYVYGKKYEEPVQLSMEPEVDELSSTEQDIDMVNKSAIDRTRFQKGNTQGVRFAPKNTLDDQEDIDDTI